MKHIDNVFKNNLYHHEVSVPEGMWEEIVPEIEKKSKRGFLWFWIAGIIALLTISTLLWYILQNSQPESPVSNTPLSSVYSLKEISSNKVITGPKNMVQDVSEETTIVAKKPTATLSSSTQDNSSENSNKISKTIEIQSLAHKDINVKKDDIMKYAKPANLVITKSYISNEGSMVEKSTWEEIKLSNRSLTYL